MIRKQDTPLQLPTVLAEGDTSRSSLSPLSTRVLKSDYVRRAADCNQTLEIKKSRVKYIVIYQGSNQRYIYKLCGYLKFKVLQTHLVDLNKLKLCITENILAILSTSLKLTYFFLLKGCHVFMGIA